MKLKPTYFLPILTICGLLLFGGFWIGDSWWEKLVNAAGSGVQPVQIAEAVVSRPKHAMCLAFLFLLHHRQRPMALSYFLIRSAVYRD